jgi:hypothetical protein
LTFWQTSFFRQEGKNELDSLQLPTWRRYLFYCKHDLITAMSVRFGSYVIVVIKIVLFKVTNTIRISRQGAFKFVKTPRARGKSSAWVRKGGRAKAFPTLSGACLRLALHVGVVTFQSN